MGIGGSGEFCVFQERGLPRGWFIRCRAGVLRRKGIPRLSGGADLFRLSSSSVIMDAVQGSVVLSRVPKTNVRWGWGCSGVSGVAAADVDSARASGRSGAV